jgi:murein DD-endopeptidase MepM/ murein hydrolase activator NlpD
VEASAPTQPPAASRFSRVPATAIIAAVLLLAAAAFGMAWMFRPDAAKSAHRNTTVARAASPKAASVAVARRVRAFHGEMDQQSFYTSAVAVGIDDRLISQITGALAFDFDFVREIHPGDVFEVAVEDGDGQAAPSLLYVSLVTAEKTKALYRFRGAWYDAQGLATQRALMRTPVEGARVTSTFGMRDHPVLGYTRMHKGVDFGVPVGTPVYASGDGTVDAIGLHTGYGFYLRIAHTKTLATAYGHLSAYPPDIKIGVHVRQGQVVAFSGNTGISTGPHLHYEILVNGEQVNPLEYKVESGSALGGETLAAFIRARDRVDAARAGAM